MGDNDTLVHSWLELMKVLYEIPKTPHERYRSNYVYRGVSDKSWRLETSLQRLGAHYSSVEGSLLRSFQKYAEPGSIPDNGLFAKLSIAQHHGLPTRLLDWTASPRIAVHFATEDEKKFDRDGAIWCVDVVQARELMPAQLRDILTQHYAFLFSVEMLSHIEKLEDFDKFAHEADFVMFFEPPSLHARIVNQWGIMSIMPDVTQDLYSFLQNHPQLYYRIIIPKEIKWEVRDKLDQDNVTERMLFPGLDGLSRWLKRYYGSGPKG